MPKEYADDPVYCEAPNTRVHQYVYMGRSRGPGGTIIRSMEYRCSACGKFITKQALKEATEHA